MNQLLLLAPEIFLSVLALVILTAEAFFPSKNRLWAHLSLAGLLLVLAHQFIFLLNGSFPGASAAGMEPVLSKGGWVQYGVVFGMISIDSLSLFFKLSILAAVILVLWLSLDYYEFTTAPLGTYSALLLLATVGMMLLVGSTDFLLAVIALELLSVNSFILTGFVFKRRTSAEGAIKFLLVGTFSTGILLFGISYYYGYFGSTSLDPLLLFPSSGQSPDMMLSLILMFILAGLGFKLAMVPFHMWAPDAYEGAPTPVTGFLSVAPKAAAIGFLVRLFGNHNGLGIAPVLAVLAAITMSVGNIGALHQNNIKRLLAYSSIAQVGYILVALVAGGSLGSQAAMVYTFVYLFMNLGVFAALIIVSNQVKSDDITVFAGLSKKSMGLAVSLVVFLLALTGIPPMSGFVGKFSIFASVIQRSDLLWLAIVAVVNSAVSLYYYFRIVHQMFFVDSDGASAASRLTFSPALVCCLSIALGVTLLAGLLPNPLLGWVRNVVGS